MAKLSTPSSLLTLGAVMGATVLWQAAAKVRPALLSPAASNILIVVGITVMAASAARMKEVEIWEVLPSSGNTRARNIFNILNIVSGVFAAAGFFTLLVLSKTFSSHWRLTVCAACACVLGLAFQAAFYWATQAGTAAKPAE